MNTTRGTSIFLAWVLASSVFLSPATANYANPNQPSIVNNMLHFWGNEDISDCWENFDSEGSMGSADQGYGEEIDGGDAERLEVSISCRMKYTLEENMYLNPTGKILIEIGVRLDHAEAESDEDKDLTVTLFKGDLEISNKSFPDLDTDEEVQLSWELGVSEDSIWWNKSDGEPRIRIEVSKVGWDASGTPCTGPLQVLKCGGSFRLYYSNNQEGLRTQIKFPINDAPEVLQVVEGEGGFTPGFGLISAFSVLALAVIVPRMEHRTPARHSDSSL